MSTDPFYRSAAWRRVCDAVRQRSGGRCEVPGCDRPGKVFDHIRSRRRGGPDTPGNVRHLCRLHDNQVKEDARGERRSGGKMTVPGCDATGMPIDPNHHWRVEEKSLGAAPLDRWRTRACSKFED